MLEARVRGHPSWVIFVELFLGFGWLRAAIAKIISSDWWSGDPIREFAALHADETLPYYEPVIEHIIAPAVVLVAIATVAIQLFIASTILSGWKIHWGLLVATALNINIIVAGGVDPSIFYLMLQGALALWLIETKPDSERSESLSKMVLRVGAAIAILSAPFVRTLQPKHVIEDPAAVLTTYGVCLVVATAISLKITTITNPR